MAKRAVLVRVALGAGAALLGLAVALPARLVGNEERAPLFFSFELGVGVLAVIATARGARGRWAPWVVAALYTALLVFLFYQTGFKAFFLREPALVEDWHFAINLFHFLSEMKTWRWHALVWGSIVGLFAFVFAVGKLLGAVQRHTHAMPRKRLAAIAIAWAVVGGTSSHLRGPIRIAGSSVVDNYRASVAARKRTAPLRDRGRDDRYDPFMDVRLAKRPSFYFLVVEAYGQILATWDMTSSYRSLMDRARVRLEAAGYHMATAYSSAPVHGGRSWLSTSTMQTGILIDEPASYAAFEAASYRIPTLAGFFRAQGYDTASLEPASKKRPGLGNDDLYAHRVRVDGDRLEYGGPPYGFGNIPDQYSLRTFRSRFLPTVAEPRYVFYFAVSTHWPWGPKSIPEFEGGPEWPPLEGTETIASDFRLGYLRTVEYEWRSLLELLEAERSQEIVIVVIGDHQPRLESNQPGEATFDTPVHVISRDAAFVARFADRGFQPGLYADPKRGTTLVHEALLSLFVSELAGAYGTPETKGLAKFYPTGISVGGLNP
ncbi:MAG: hypothetical protein JST00_37970 [Deltaproteobacteria bacterium]|nr:hypothetical protein [Deltaproteobacteria bacterium]